MELQKTNKNYPFIEKLVDSLYTKELNEIMESENVKEDKNTFMMFIAMYFSIRVHSESITKDDIKIFMTELVRDQSKRRKCIELFNQMSNLISPRKTLRLLN
jgi:hypothetical protein